MNRGPEGKKDPRGARLVASKEYCAETPEILYVRSSYATVETSFVDFQPEKV